MPIRKLISTAQAARELGISRTKFYEIRPQLEAEGFPLRIPGTTRYDPAAIEAWLDGRSPATSPGTRSEAEILDLIERRVARHQK